MICTLKKYFQTKQDSIQGFFLSSVYLLLNILKKLQSTQYICHGHKIKRNIICENSKFNILLEENTRLSDD